MWKRTSSSISRSWRRRPTNAPNDETISWYQAMSSPLEGVAEHAVHGTGRPCPLLDLGVELAHAFARNHVIAGAAVVLARAPLGAYPAAAKHFLERRIERALVDVEDVARDLPELQ